MGLALDIDTIDDLHHLQDVTGTRRYICTLTN
jgi:hypothetical protein